MKVPVFVLILYQTIRSLGLMRDGLGECFVGQMSVGFNRGNLLLLWTPLCCKGRSYMRNSSPRKSQDSLV